ncbi:MAG TPA: hypothetical protein VM075_11230 [Anaerolineae bacterium]|nr:hypothetical protein [Anaerolineae bacterium]
MAEVSRDTAQGFEVAPFDTLLRCAPQLLRMLPFALLGGKDRGGGFSPLQRTGG